MPINSTSSKNNTIETPLIVVKHCLESMDIKETDNVLDCCAGLNKIWYNNLNCEKDYCEILEGIDFINYSKETDYIIGNLPFNIFKKFFNKILQLNPNKGIGIICLEHSITPNRLLLLQKKGFYIEKIIKLKIKEWKFGFNVNFYFFHKKKNETISVLVC